MQRRLVSAVVGCLAAGTLFLVACGRSDERALPTQAGAPSSGGQTPAGDYVGRATCAECHADEVEAWTGSHHDLAMQIADESTVLGDFSGVSFTHFGETTTFSRRGDKFIVHTPGPDGVPTDFEVAYTFGVTPLQQYLLPLPGGRLQALSVAWDARPAEQGGQRWYHLYRDEDIPAGDELHWTRRSQNWNFSCAECHSTDLRRNYDLESNSYATRWSEIDVSCEACHGAGSRHVAWARAGGLRDADASLGLAIDLTDRSGGQWVMNGERGIAERTAAPVPDHQLDTCGRCHARRRQIAEGYAPDAPLMDTHVPAFLGAGLYHADGQIRDEVYVWGSFQQSRMHAAGVRCTDCHDAHSLRVHAPDNSLCGVCHLDERFDTPAHTHHPAAGPGANCVDCHMPATVYMGVDARRDHGFRVPRPDLSALLGTPDVCSACHAEHDAAWAAEQVASWFPDSSLRTRPNPAAVFAAAWEQLPGVDGALAQVALDGSQPALVRASALAELANRPSPQGRELLAYTLSDADPLVRLGTLEALTNFPAALRMALAWPLIDDPSLAVRSMAARLMADSDLQPAMRPAFDSAMADWTAIQKLNLDTPQAHHNLALADQVRELTPQAEAGYKRALRLEPDFVPAAVNLADLIRNQGREEEAQGVLREALTHAPRSAPLHLALGLALVRVGSSEAALESLRKAHEFGPEDAHIAYVYAVALSGRDGPAGAAHVLDQALVRHPRDIELLSAAASFQRDAGNLAAALIYARRLGEQLPGDGEVAGLIAELEAALR